jgi:hypothetical protein
MKVQIEDVQLIIKWRHNSKNNLEIIDGDAIQPLSTQCLIYAMVDGKKELFKKSEALCSFYDKFNKQKGRIVSLTKAIKHLPKDVRKLFWDSYKAEINFK